MADILAPVAESAPADKISTISRQYCGFYGDFSKFELVAGDQLDRVD